jgi:hypothetical protein
VLAGDEPPPADLDVRQVAAAHLVIEQVAGQPGQAGGFVDRVRQSFIGWIRCRLAWHAAAGIWPFRGTFGTQVRCGHSPASGSAGWLHVHGCWSSRQAQVLVRSRRGRSGRVRRPIPGCGARLGAPRAGRVRRPCRPGSRDTSPAWPPGAWRAAWRFWSLVMVTVVRSGVGVIVRLPGRIGIRGVRTAMGFQDLGDERRLSWSADLVDDDHVPRTACWPASGGVRQREAVEVLDLVRILVPGSRAGTNGAANEHASIQG